MDPGQLPLCALFTAISWPHRLPDVLLMFPERPANGPFDRLLWDTLQRCAAHGIPQRPADLHERMLFDIQAHCPDHAARFVQYVQELRNRTDLVESYCIELLRSHAMQDLRMRMPLLDTDAEMQAASDRLDRLRRIGAANSARRVDLFANNGRDILTPMPRIPLECCVLDELFGGLPPPGTMTLWVMPTKSGKTLLSTQASKACVHRGFGVLDLNFEQQAKGDLGCRIYTAMSDEPIGTFKSVAGLDECPADVRRRISEAQPMWEENFALLDINRLSEPGLFSAGVDSLRDIVETEFVQRVGRYPDLIICDWWQRMWEACQASMDTTKWRGDAAMRRLEAREFLKLKLMAGEWNTRIFVMQQVRAALAGTAINIDRISPSDAAENKSLPFLADASVVSTMKTADHCVSFKLCLDRNQESGTISRFRMLGDLQRFVPYDNAQEQSAAAIAANAEFLDENGTQTV